MQAPPLTLVWNPCSDPMLWLDDSGRVLEQNVAAKARLNCCLGDALAERGPQLAGLFQALLTRSQVSGLVDWGGSIFQGTLQAVDEGAVLTLVQATGGALQAGLVAQSGQLDRMKTTAELAKLGFWELDVDSTELSWSAETFRIHELDSRLQPTVEQALAFYAPEKRAQVRDVMELCIASGQDWSLGLPITTAKGTKRWVRSLGWAEFLDGRATRLFGTIQDQTLEHEQRLELEEALEAAKEFQQLFQTARTMVCTASVDGMFLRLNAEWTRTLGWSLEELQGQPFLSFIHPADQARTLEFIGGLMPQGVASTDFENRYLHKDGSYRWLRWHSFTPAEQGRFYAVASDATDTRRQQQHHARLSMAVSRTDDGVVVTDPFGRVEWVNEGFVRMVGFTRKQVIGRTPGSLLQGKNSDPGAVSRMQQAVRNGTKFHEELINYKPDGTPYWIEIHGRPLLEDAGELLGFMRLQRDVTERHEHHAELIAAKERADRSAMASLRASQAKSDFLASMSHEIRTPLNGVLGLAQLIESGELNPDQRLYIQQVLTSGRSLLSLLDDILDFSKVEAGLLELHSEPFALADVVSEVVGLFRASADAKDVALNGLVHPVLPDWIRGDGERLRQVLFNLVGNAVKFTHQGTIDLFVTPSKNRDGWFRVVVSDTGIGVSEEKQESIFQSFAQSDTSTTREFGGTGLGLSISKQLIELMGGRIWVESALGAGSKFMIELPIIELSPGQSRGLLRSHIQPPRTGLCAHVLVVEDNLVNQMVAVGMIHRLGGTTRVAKDGQQALEWMERERFSLVLMDWHMPVMDGLEATRAIRTGEEGTDARTPIVGLTANAYDAQAQVCLDAGMDAVLTKPVEWESLVRAITKWSRVASPSP
ncbi:MAG: PAS domain S-box-containing protein [Cognaticolwellia sp.]|jgi:PAS domain S-box-containing protein